MMQTDKPLRLRLGHSPDPDDAFMWWPIVCDEGSAAGFDTGDFRFEQVLDDIESLNHRAQAGELQITAISCAQYPYVADRYALTACGSSMGDSYGPTLLALPSGGRRELTRYRAALDAINRALSYLRATVKQITIAGLQLDCVVERGHFKIGGNALAVLALSKYITVTGDRSDPGLARLLAEFKV